MRLGGYSEAGGVKVKSASAPCSRDRGTSKAQFQPGFGDRTLAAITHSKGALRNSSQCLFNCRSK